MGFSESGSSDGSRLCNPEFWEVSHSFVEVLLLTSSLRLVVSLLMGFSCGMDIPFDRLILRSNIMSWPIKNKN